MVPFKDIFELTGVGTKGRQVVFQQDTLPEDPGWQVAKKLFDLRPEFLPLGVVY